MPLPKRLIPLLEDQLKKSKLLYQQDRENGIDGVYLPDALSKKYPNAATKWKWQYVFYKGKTKKRT